MINNEGAWYMPMHGEAVSVPDWLTDPADRAKWLTLSDRDRSDWARAHGSAVASSSSAAAAEAAGRKAAEAREQAQAAAMQKASDAAAARAGYPVKPWYQRRGVLIAGGVGAGVLILILATRKAPAPSVVHYRSRK